MPFQHKNSVIFNGGAICNQFTKTFCTGGVCNGSATDGRTVTSGQGLRVHSDYQNKGVRYRIRNYAIRESLKGVPIVKFVGGVTRTTEAAGIKAKKRTCSDHHHERCKLFVMFFLLFAMFFCYQPFCRPLIIRTIYDLQNFHIILLKGIYMLLLAAGLQFNTLYET